MRFQGIWEYPFNRAAFAFWGGWGGTREGEKSVSRKDNLILKFLALLVILKPEYVPESPKKFLKMQSLSPRPVPKSQSPWGWTTWISITVKSSSLLIFTP